MKIEGTVKEANNTIATPVLVLRQSDNVGVLRLPLSAGDVIEVGGRSIDVQEAISPGHKIALKKIPQGSPVIKYAEIIANATSDIAAGAWVHTHNTVPDFSGREYEYATRTPVTDFFPTAQVPTFMGFQRENGDIGTRNYIAVIATSNCSSHVVAGIAEQMRHVRAGDAWCRRGRCHPASGGLRSFAGRGHLAA
jgi:altronate dehydratase